MISLTRTTSDNPDFKSLVLLLDKELAIRDGDDHAFYSQYNKIVNIKNVVIAYDNGKPVGCGAFKPFEANAVEIKRMYVNEDSRGKRIARQILSELELWAVEIGYDSFVLETGLKQPEAISLYKNMGYEIIPNYGQYQGVENSVCFQKQG
ncbi:GNAT family N-acetyltransferase [Pedobacter panaciterrae]|jgi:N-acetylglutamate synthase and related acetyltransferases|uniref:GNAT family N-acetyltransferase n=1 Tax=Pedobacter panaciterrae TaxID=363849 RepID=UPI00155D8AD3|nr:GNAT family N-acetyltransferase [Pedobacter panaciterrae]NQX53429.1 GNAT family N-acetyltransferase [Pedobacter panaciterrae]